MAGELASQLACGVVEPLYAQIDPNRIGEMQRAIQIAHEYGTRLDGHGSNLKEGALDALVAGYPSHSFVIDRKEARNLFKSVQPLTRAEQQACTTLWFLMGEQANDFCTLLEPTGKTATQQEDNDAQGPKGRGDAVGPEQGVTTPTSDDPKGTGPAA